MNEFESKNVVFYTRNSTRLQELNKTHEVHLESLRNYSKKHNYNEMRTFIDKAKSGKNKKREGLEALLNFIKTNYDEKNQKNKIDFVLITKIDRLIRNWIEFNDIYKVFLKYKVGFKAIEQSNLDLSEWDNLMVKVFVTVLGLAADIERTFINERRESGKAYARIHGTKSGKPMHRPKIPLNEKIIIDDWNAKPSVRFLSRKHKVSWATMNNKLLEMGLK